jgi:YVTN family beta-propeller protein
MAIARRNFGIAWAVALAASTVLGFVADLAAGELKRLASIDLPGPSGLRFDYLTIDYDDHYLFCAHLGPGLLYVIDLPTNKVVKTISDLPGIEGVEYAPDEKKLYTSDWHEDKIGVVDVKTLQIVKKIPTESKPDGSAYAAPFHKLYVSDERAKAVAVVDTTRDEVLRMLRFDSETGMPQYDPVAKKIYVNLQDQNIFAVIDPENDQVVGMHPVVKCKGNHGMALDAEHRRAFLACEQNSLLAVMDLDKFEPIAYLPLADGADVVKFDPGLNRIYVACYSGAISIIEQKDLGQYRKLKDVTVAHAVHSLAVDTSTHRVYAPEQEQDGVPVARLMIYEAAGK